MRKFLYNAMNSSGTITKDMVEANTIEEARDVINQQKLVILKIKEKKILTHYLEIILIYL